MKSARLLDSYALVNFLREERGFKRVQGLLREAAHSGEPLLMCELNLGEVFYVIGREEGLPRAEEILASLSTLPLKRIPLTWDTVLQAARLKAQYALSYADCVAAASAVEENAVLVTGDPGFRALEHLVKIEWI